MSTLKKNQIVARFVLSCGSSCKFNEDIFCSFNGMGTEIVIASRNDNTFYDERGFLKRVICLAKFYVVKQVD